MSSSFFKKKIFQIIEKQIVDNKFVLSEKDHVLKAYDFSSWKLTPQTETKQTPSLAKQEEKMQELKEKHLGRFGLIVTTACEIQTAVQYASFLYIPGEFCRQSDVLEAAKNSGIPLVVEKGVFLSPNDIKRLCEKIQGSDYAVVECGSANGYSDAVLDPRSLFLMKKNSCYFGVSLADLLAPEGVQYAHRPQWLNNNEFIEAFIKTSLAFSPSFFVINDKLNSDKILNMMRK